MLCKWTWYWIYQDNSKRFLVTVRYCAVVTRESEHQWMLKAESDLSFVQSVFFNQREHQKTIRSHIVDVWYNIRPWGVQPTSIFSLKDQIRRVQRCHNNGEIWHHSTEKISMILLPWQMAEPAWAWRHKNREAAATGMCSKPAREA